jgi:peptidyl-tRNA hydrolase, PTH2 family
MNSKQVLIFDKSLKVRRGKEAAQLSHAAMGVILGLMTKSIDENYHNPRHTWTLEFDEHSPLGDWLLNKFTKICLYAKDHDELMQCYHEAQAAGLPCSLITDAGNTEFHGVPTITAIGIGPADSNAIDLITKPKNLQLM